MRESKEEKFPLQNRTLIIHNILRVFINLLKHVRYMLSDDFVVKCSKLFVCSSMSLGCGGCPGILKITKFAFNNILLKRMFY